MKHGPEQVGYYQGAPGRDHSKDNSDSNYGMPLAIVAIKTIKALIHWITLRSWASKSPLSESTGNIALLLENLRHGNLIHGNRSLPFWFQLSIVSDECIGCLPVISHLHQNTTWNSQSSAKIKITFPENKIVAKGLDVLNIHPLIQLFYPNKTEVKGFTLLLP